MIQPTGLPLSLPPVSTALRSVRGGGSVVFDRPGYRVLAVFGLPVDGRRDAAAAKGVKAGRPGCGLVSSRVQQRTRQRVNNLCAGGRGIGLVVIKPQVLCAEAGCGQRSFTRVADQAGFPVRCTSRLKEAAIETVLDEGAPIWETCARYRFGWATDNTSVTGETLTIADQVPVRELGFDEGRFVGAKWVKHLDTPQLCQAQPERLQRKLSQGGFDVRAYSDAGRNENTLYKRLLHADFAVVVREHTPLRHPHSERLQNLGLIVSTGTNTSVTDLEAGVRVLGTPSMVLAIAEDTWALIFALARHAPGGAERLRADRRQHAAGMGLEGKTHRLLNPWQNWRTRREVRHSCFHLDPELDPRAGRGRRSTIPKPQLSVRSTGDTLAAPPASPVLRGTINKELLATMKSHALLVTAPVDLIDEEGILDTMEYGRLERFSRYLATEKRFSVKSFPPRTFLNTTFPPHLRFVTDENASTFVVDVIGDIHAFLCGDFRRKVTT